MPDRALFFEHEGNRAVRLGDWKAVWTNCGQTWELYNIRRDRSETNDRADEFPDRVRQMAQLLDNWAKSHFVERRRVQQPSAGMPKIYNWRDGR